MSERIPKVDTQAEQLNTEERAASEAVFPRVERSSNSPDDSRERTIAIEEARKRLNAQAKDFETVTATEMPEQEPVSRTEDLESAQVAEARRLKETSFKEQKVRGKVSVALLFGGAASMSAGLIAPVLGAEATAAVTAGVLGMAGFAGGFLVLPPALYAWHKFKEWRRGERFERTYGKQLDKRDRSIWGF